MNYEHKRRKYNIYKTCTLKFVIVISILSDFKILLYQIVRSYLISTTLTRRIEISILKFKCKTLVTTKQITLCGLTWPSVSINEYNFLLNDLVLGLLNLSCYLIVHWGSICENLFRQENYRLVKFFVITDLFYNFYLFCNFVFT